MKILSAFILCGRAGGDHVSLDTDLPNPSYPYDGTLSISFVCAKGTAEEYVKKHFPKIPVKVKSEPVVDYKFSKD